MVIQHTDTSYGKIAYVHAGQGEPLLLLHSMGNSSWSYHSVMDMFAEHFSVYALDMLGHGESDLPSQKMSMHDFAQSCIDFMDVHGIDKAHVIGNSVGGTLTLSICQGFPNRILKAVLVGCPAYTVEEAIERRKETKIREAEQNANPEPLPDPTDIAGQLRIKAKDGIPIARDAMYDFDALDACTQIQIPTLVLFGDQDALQERTDRFRTLKNAEFVTIHNAGHVTMLDQPIEFSEKVLQFLNS